MSGSEFPFFEESTLSRRQFLKLLAWLGGAAALPALPGCRGSAQTLDGRTPITPYLAEDHSQFLSRWAARGVRDAVLINIDTHDDIVRIPDEKIADLKNIYSRGDWGAFAAADERTSTNNGLYGIASWIYAGGMLGIFSEVYWVTPFKLPENGSSVSGLRQLLTELCFRGEDIATFTPESGRFRGRVNGIPFIICTPETLPAISKPLLLSIDTDFFPAYSDVCQASFLNLLHRLFTALNARKYRLLDAAVCYSVNGEYLKPHLCWIAEAVVKIFADPAMIVNDAPSELLKLQQHLENAFRSGDGDEILLRSGEYLELHKGEPSLLLYQALGYLLKGDEESAYRAAMESARIEKRYASALQQLGTICYLRQRYQAAAKFHQAGFAVDPDMTVGLFQYGNCLQKLGNLPEALRVYEKDARLNGSFPAHFMAAQVLLKLGDFSGAEITLKEALKELERYAAPRVLSREAADAIYAIMDYCDNKGLNSMGDALQRNKMTKLMQKEFPRERKRGLRG